MWTDGGREVARPRGAVLGPLAFLLAAAATGFGMWHALTHEDDAPLDQLSRHDRPADDRLVQGRSR